MRAARSDSPPPSRKVPAVTGQASLGEGTSASTSSPGLEGVSVPALGGQRRACSSRRSLPTRPETETRARSRPLPFFCAAGNNDSSPPASPSARLAPPTHAAGPPTRGCCRPVNAQSGGWWSRSVGAGRVCGRGEAGATRHARPPLRAPVCLFSSRLSLTSPCPPGLPHAHSPTAPLPTHHVQARHRRPGPGRVRVRRRAVGEWGRERVQRVRRQWRLTRGG